ncbi:GIY-YIG nuclease family protein [Priestia megaterium]|uniref:GIY-YIG nuclease family protein n=1 Tax=Priestia megaterium TaxID=1404 RepID=UPI0035E01D60
MNNKAKTIQIFLPDGNPRGIKIAEVTNRTVQAILIPKNLLEEAKERDEVLNVGLYFLFDNELDGAKPQVYIGEAENSYERLKQHIKGKEFWEYAVLIVTNNKQNQFTKTDVKFLENLSFIQAKSANRFRLNQTIPTKSFVPEWRQADLVDIFETIKLLLGTLGYPIFDELRNDMSIGEEITKDTFYCKGRGVIAEGELVSDGFVVYKGSEMALEPVKSFKERYSYHINRIKNMEKEGIVEVRNNKYIFLEDYLFNSPSAAADCVLQRSSNGWLDWKDTNGKTLDEIKRRQL